MNLNDVIFLFFLENDECANESLSRCNQTCVNTFGSFYCECRDGFTKLEEGRVCEGIVPLDNATP